MVDTERRRILIVDDESSVRDVIERILQEAGHRDIAQADCVAAAQTVLADKGPFALVILDIRMPGKQGLELLKDLARLAPYTVTIMATGSSGIETAIEALKMGAYDYLVKPLIPDAVQLAVARALRKRLLEVKELERRERIEKLVRERTRSLDATRHALLNALCTMAEFRDAETGAHLRRIPEYARVLALDLAHNSPYADQITEEFVARLVECAPLHDIGKVAVPDAILLKPGKLTPEEFEIVKLHAVRGRDICLLVKRQIGEKEASFINVAIEVIYGHHERWDGRGYPEGRVGAETPLSGRIVHLADFYDACRSARVYRPGPIPRDEVVEMVRQGRGTDFDPQVADAFERTLSQIAEVEEICDYAWT